MPCKLHRLKRVANGQYNECRTRCQFKTKNIIDQEDIQITRLEKVCYVNERSLYNTKPYPHNRLGRLCPGIHQHQTQSCFLNVWSKGCLKSLTPREVVAKIASNLAATADELARGDTHPGDCLVSMHGTEQSAGMRLQAPDVEEVVKAFNTCLSKGSPNRRPILHPSMSIGSFMLGAACSRLPRMLFAMQRTYSKRNEFSHKRMSCKWRRRAQHTSIEIWRSCT